MTTAFVPSSTHQDKVFVAGEWKTPRSGARHELFAPSTEESIGSVAVADAELANEALTAARSAFDTGAWTGLSYAQRAGYVAAIADAVAALAPEADLTPTAEVGFPVRVGPGTRMLGVTIARDFLPIAEVAQIEEDRAVPGGIARIVKEPVGVTVAIVPFNGQIPLIMSKLAPALIAGCTVIVKPAIETAFSNLLLAEAIEAAGLPKGVVSVLNGGSDVGAELINSPLIDKIAFTGGGETGRKILAASAQRFVRTTLELGGKSAAIILDDADPEQVVNSIIPNSLTNSGQMCRALTRIVVSENRHDEYVEALAAAFAEFKVGDPFKSDTAAGPLATEASRARVEQYVESGRAQGARVVVGGNRPAGFDKGWYFESTLFDQVTRDMRIAQEEIFGPVVSVLTYKDVDDAVEIANDSAYGLSGIVYTLDPDLGLSIARRVRAGSFNVSSVGVAIRQPFGGYKCSGIGREGGPEGLDPYVELKQIFIPEALAG